MTATSRSIQKSTTRACLGLVDLKKFLDFDIVVFFHFYLINIVQS